MQTHEGDLLFVHDWSWLYMPVERLKDDSLNELHWKRPWKMMNFTRVLRWWYEPSTVAFSSMTSERISRVPKCPAPCRSDFQSKRFKRRAGARSASAFPVTLFFSFFCSFTARPAVHRQRLQDAAFLSQNVPSMKLRQCWNVLSKDHLGRQSEANQNRSQTFTNDESGA